MADHDKDHDDDLWARASTIWLIGITVATILVAFLLLPSIQPDFAADGLWSAICRAAGVPAKWAGVSTATDANASEVFLEPSMTHPAKADSVGRGATLALNCTMCHGAKGISASDSPNLAGQYPEVVIKQLHDYKSGRRQSALMESIARNLSDRDIDDLAAYFAYLPKARTAPTTYGEDLPVLVRNGAPMRNIAPCISCHGDVDQKLGAPWLEGMPKQYLVTQLKNFASEARHNDSEAQMRNMVRGMTDPEIDQVAEFYARKASVAEIR